MMHSLGGTHTHGRPVRTGRLAASWGNLIQYAASLQGEEIGRAHV